MTWRPVTPASDWNAMEERVLAFWRERRIFARSMERRADAEPFVFYEGPPTANGRPGSHHVLARVFKDVFPRFQAMRGRFVDRRGGWDCHGLPVEIEVERRLGISGKRQIEEYGIAEFNALCREAVLEYLDEWERLTERIGFWLDTDRAYRTMDTGYIESVWWSLAELHRRGLLYRSGKVVPYCPRCGTALSSHEVAQGYEDVDDLSAYVRFPLRDAPGESLMVWTTTPWTLPANQAAAIHPDVPYAAVRDGDETLIVAEPLVARLFGEDARPERTIAPAELVGREYEPPFPFLPGAHRVVEADFVTTEDGTGIVHIAPAFGEDDMAVGRRHGLDAPNPVGLDGRFTSAVGPWEGRAVKEADADLVADLESRGRLWRSEVHHHSYPHCWRCGTALIYYAKPSWYVRTTEVRDRMLALNAGIGWRPERVRDGRFGRWLEGNIDWAISRDRYWGTPLPLWRCGDCDRVDAIGSYAELRARSDRPLPDDFDPHRPLVDEVHLTCDCGGSMCREPEVIDVWYDSGAMPFAQQHHPFATGGDLSGLFPADFICEGLDQTRGWFYSLLAESTLLFDESSYRNVVCLGLILDAEGQKMSKSRGNVIEPWTVIDRQGADAFRWYLLTDQPPWDNSRFSLEAVDEAKRRFLLTLWNTYSFLVMYASLEDGWSPDDGGPPLAERRPIDRWILSRLDGTLAAVTARLEDYDSNAAGARIESFLDDLSNWYVRVGRARFWGGRRDGAAGDDGRAAFATLHECLATLARMVAPFCPFVAEEIHGAIVAAHDAAAPESVHLCDWPEPAGRHDPALETAMAAAREVVGVGLRARAESALKVRQPLGEAVVAGTPALAEAVAPLVDLVAAELNVKAVRFVTDPGDLVEVTLKPNYRRLGPRFGTRMPAVAEAVAALPATETARAIDAGEPVSIVVDAAAEPIEADDLLREARPSEGYALAQEGAVAVGLATEITPELRAEALAREVIHAVQGARRAAGLRVEQRIVLHLDGSGVMREVIDAHRAAIAAETLAVELTVSHGAPFAGLRHEELVLDGEPFALRLDVAAEPAAAGPGPGR
ncbi:MAG: isoleucine--tRNA ligase [Thermoleophilia bacterium]